MRQLKRKELADNGHYEPTLAAATRNLGDRVEIRIRDNGTGIPPEVKEKMFNPFFTTKPAGEGTGLGLSISHDIIVKQHAGSIEVETAARRVHRIPHRAAASGGVPRQIGRASVTPARSRGRRRAGHRGAVSPAIPARTSRRPLHDEIRANPRRRRLRYICDAESRSPILILSDINMPGMSGLELLAEGQGGATRRSGHHDHRLRRCRDQAQGARRRRRRSFHQAHRLCVASQ